jgi:hypothetical protein
MGPQSSNHSDLRALSVTLLGHPAAGASARTFTKEEESMTSQELRNVAVFLGERIQIHGRLVGASLSVDVISEMSRLAVKAEAEAKQLDAEAKKKAEDEASKKVAG